MPKRVMVKDHLSEKELEERYRESFRLSEKRAWQVILSIYRGKKTEEVAKLLDLTPHWIRQLVKRYNEGGPEALQDTRKYNKGRRPLLSEEQLWQLKELISQPPADGGSWTAPKVAKWMSQQFGIKVSRQRAWVYLKRLEKLEGMAQLSSDEHLPKKATQERTNDEKEF